MRRAFCRVELLAILAVVCVSMVLFIPAVVKAGDAATQVSCAGNVRKLGLALASFRMDHGDRWNLGGCTLVDFSCETLAIALNQGYIKDSQTLVCPDLDTPHARNPHFLEKGKGDDWPHKCHLPHPDGPPVDWWGIEEIAYFLDEGRIHQNSPPTRAVLADGIEMCTKYGPEPANHADGANALFVDLAVQWCAKERPDVRWLKGVGQYGVGLTYADGQVRPHLHSGGATKGPWVRYGYIPNPRISEDGLPDDLDDIYECEGTPPMLGTDPDNPYHAEHDSAAPDVPDEFFSYAKCHRCNTKEHWGSPSKTDCAVAGGAMLPWWDTWRGGYRLHSEPGPGTWYKGEGEGYDGLTWGIPEEFE